MLARLTFGRVLLLGLMCAVLLEAITVFFRVGLGLQSTRDTGVLASFTGGVRIHHGYLGLALFPIALCVKSRAVRNALLILGLGLLISDLFHHFLVLWPLTGSPQFDLVYPAAPK